VEDHHHSAARVRDRLEENLLRALHESCARGLAHARLAHALGFAVSAVDHRALTLRKRKHSQGETIFVELVGRPLMRWCFNRDHVDVYCDDDGAQTQLRLRYSPDAEEWRISAPGRRPFIASFAREEEKILEMLEDALGGACPEIQPSSP
jgi:hypothetical protein